MINTMATMLSKDRFIVQPAPIGGAVSHVTTSLACFSLEENLFVWDTWGLSPKNYHGNQLSYLVAGLMPEGWTMVDGVDRRDPNDSDLNKCTAKFRRSHAVLFFLPAGSLHDADEMRRLGEEFEKLIRQKINPIVLIAMADCEEPEIRSQPFGTFESMEKVTKAASVALNIPPNRIFPAVPYRNEKDRNFDVDRLAYTILEEAIVCANYFKAHQEGKDEQQHPLERVIPNWRNLPEDEKAAWEAKLAAPVVNQPTPPPVYCPPDPLVDPKQPSIKDRLAGVECELLGEEGHGPLSNRIAAMEEAMGIVYDPSNKDLGARIAALEKNLGK